MNIIELDQAIKAVCPIDGIDSAGGIAFGKTATDAQKAQAKALMDSNLPALNLSPPKQLTFQSIEGLLKKIGVSDADIEAAKK